MKRDLSRTPYAWLQEASIAIDGRGVFCITLLMLASICSNVARAARIEHVVLISVDGLPGSVLQSLIANDVVGDYAGFAQLASGATTFNAHADWTHTTTLPNHISMLTGRPVSQPAGQATDVHHGYTSNTSPAPTDTIHNVGNPNVAYVESVYDVLYRSGVSSAMYTSKNKFAIFEQSYNAADGPQNPVHMNDLIGRYVFSASGSPLNASSMHSQFLSDIGVSHFQFSFVHYRDPDTAGHSFGWESAEWIDAVKRVDGYLRELLNIVESDPVLLDKTVLILTADHGGTGGTHVDATEPLNYTVPFFVWGAGVSPGTDLYAINATTRTDPAVTRPDYNSIGQPIRNSDSGNLALGLLGLEPVAGSTINVQQDLAISEPETLGEMIPCLAGPNIGTAPAGCLNVEFQQADLDGDGDVDLADFIWLPENPQP